VIKHRPLFLVLSIFTAALFALSGCASTKTTMTSWLDGLFEDEFVFLDVPNIDYSYPVADAVAERGAIAFQFKFHKREPPPIAANDILVCMDIRKDRWFWPWLPEKRGGPYLLIFTGETDQYAAKADIFLGSSQYKAELVIWKHFDDASANKFRFIVLMNAHTETVSVEMNNFIAAGSTLHVVRHPPPYPWGDLVLNGRACPLFSVIEEDYYAKHPDFSRRERGTEWFGYVGSRVETTAKNFLKSGRKFQITNNARAVVAELQGNAYTLYGALPEAERDGMKQDLALFHTFRYIAQKLITQMLI
jgi:hypothetical protein